METPKWKKIIGDEHTLNNSSIGHDLLALEEFANDMLGLGWRLVRMSGEYRFTFVPCVPGEFICRTAITVTKNGFYDKQAAAALSELLVADGAFLVEQRNSMGTRIGLIALRPAALGPFEITSDLDSRIAEYQARMKYYKGLGAAFFAIAFVYLPLSFTSGNYAFLGLFVCFVAIASIYWRPVGRYKKIIARLKAERDVSEV